MVERDTSAHGRGAVIETTIQRCDGSLFEECNNPRRAEHGHVSAPESEGGVRVPNREVCRSGGADHDLHMGQTVPPVAPTRPLRRW